MVVLRDLVEKDLEYLVKYLNEDNITKYLTRRIPRPYTHEDAKWWFNVGSNAGVTKIIEVDGLFAGSIGATIGEFEYERSAEIGYWLAKEYWGKGIATEALNQMTNQILSSTEVVRIFAPVFSPNIASMRVLEKCGYILEGVLKKALYKNGDFFDKYLFAKVAS